MAVYLRDNSGQITERIHIGGRNSYHRSIRPTPANIDYKTDNLFTQASICDFWVELNGLELCAIAANGAVFVALIKLKLGGVVESWSPWDIQT